MFTPDEVERWQRHFTLPEVGPDGQRRLRSSRVLVIGAGGLGSPCLLYLAAAGVGTLGIVDPDVVELSNLQRQVIHGTADIGRLKVDSAREAIARIDPGVTVNTWAERLNTENAVSLCRGWDLVVDATDDPRARFAIDGACEHHRIPWIYGAIHRFEGQVCVFDPAHGASFRDLHPAPPPPALAPSCATAGVLGVLPGVIGAMQAGRAIRVLLAGAAEIGGVLHVIDPWNMTFFAVRIERGVREAASEADPPAWARLDPPEVEARLKRGWSPWIIDLRTAAEREAHPLAVAGALPEPDLQGLRDLEGPLLLVCQRGARSTAAATRLIDLGVPASQIFELRGGASAWRRPR